MPIVETDLDKFIEVEVRPRSNGLPVCSGCFKVTPGDDTMPTPRRFHFVPMWGMAVVFVYFMRRVKCPDCGLSNRSLDGIESIGIDEVQRHRVHKYQTLDYQIDKKSTSA